MLHRPDINASKSVSASGGLTSLATSSAKHAVVIKSKTAAKIRQ
jgi:hypothetical protein